MNDFVNGSIGHVEEPAVSRAPAPRRSRLKGLLWLALALLAIGAAAYFYFPHPETPRERAGRFGAPGPMPVAVATVEKGNIAVNLRALGTVTPLATVTVKTQINGQLTQIAFKEGQMVKQGDLLAQIDPRPYQLQLEQAEGQLQRDQALLKNAQLDVVRYRTLVKQDSIARQQLDTQEALVRQYEGTVAADQAQVDNAKLNLVYCRITAPVTGRVGLRQVDQGNYVQTSDANGIVVITQLQPITVLFTLPQDNLPAIMKRLRAGATLPVTAYDRSSTVALAKGVLTTVDNQIDVATGTVKLKAQFDNEDEALFPNQFVNVELLVDTLSDVPVLPAAAVLRGAPGTYVYAVNPDSTVSVRTVKLGPAEGERVAVLGGIDPGTRVVVEGTDRLRDDAKVTIPEPAGSGAKAASPAAVTPGAAGGDQAPGRQGHRRSGP